MAIGYGYDITGIESGHGSKGGEGCNGDGVAESVEAVCTAVTGAIHRHYGSVGPEPLARLLTAYWGPLRHQLLTDGVTATQRSGGSWESSAGPISVKIWCL